MPGFMTVRAIHGEAIKAVNSMLDLAKRHRRSITEMTEAQLSHALGQRLIDAGYSVFFEAKYHAAKGQWKRSRADMFAIATRGRKIWIEVKFTGLDSASNINNQIGTVYAKDFSKLRGLDNRTDRIENAGYWVWLHLTNYYRDVLSEKYPGIRTWTKPMGVGKAAEVFGRTRGKPGTVGKVLKDVGREARQKAICSIQPNVTDALHNKQNPFTVILTTAKLK